MSRELDRLNAKYEDLSEGDIEMKGVPGAWTPKLFTANHLIGIALGTYKTRTAANVGAKTRERELLSNTARQIDVEEARLKTEAEKLSKKKKKKRK